MNISRHTGREGQGLSQNSGGLHWRKSDDLRGLLGRKKSCPPSRPIYYPSSSCPQYPPLSHCPWYYVYSFSVLHDSCNGYSYIYHIEIVTLQPQLNMLPWFLWYCVWHRFSCWHLYPILHFLILITTLYILLYLFCHTWPLVVSGNQLYCLPLTFMTCSLVCHDVARLSTTSNYCFIGHKLSFSLILTLCHILSNIHTLSMLF